MGTKYWFLHPRLSVPENFRQEVDRQISELLKLKFIEPCTSPHVSPLVCVRDKDGKRSIRICTDYRYVNSFTKSSAFVLEDISEIIQRVGNYNFISRFDAKSGYQQCSVKVEDRWLTGFVHGTSVYQFTRCPFGLKSIGDTFVRFLCRVLTPVRWSTETFVDDSAVHSICGISI